LKDKFTELIQNENISLLRSCSKIKGISMVFNKTIRPISPHLTIYKPQVTSTLSIFHRITGSVLSLLVLVSLMFFRLYTLQGENSYSHVLAQYLNTSTSHWLILSAAFLLLFSFYYHTCNGIRHMMWDLGYGLDIRQLYTSGYAVLAASFILTVMTWVLPGLLG
jgi:succinate dehydrogenase / fumarate reductase cytochrome b subunit